MMEQTVRYLVDEEGMPEGLARLVLRDDDLWVLHAGARSALPPGEADLAEWERAYDFAASLADGFAESKAINEHTRMLLWDLRARAAEALRRARERAARSS